MPFIIPGSPACAAFGYIQPRFSPPIRVREGTWYVHSSSTGSFILNIIEIIMFIIIRKPSGPPSPGEA